MIYSPSVTSCKGSHRDSFPLLQDTKKKDQGYFLRHILEALEGYLKNSGKLRFRS